MPFGSESARKRKKGAGKSRCLSDSNKMNNIPRWRVNLRHARNADTEKIFSQPSNDAARYELLKGLCQAIR